MDTKHSKINQRKKGRPKAPGRMRIEAGLESVSVMEFLDYRSFLQKLYDKIKSTHRYSYYQFAEDLGLPKNNAIWMILKNRRNMIKSTVEKVIKALSLNGRDKEYFRLLVAYEHANTSKKREQIFDDMYRLKTGENDDEERNLLAKYYSKWYYPIIRELVSLNDFKHDPSWISKKLNVKVKRSEIEGALDLLEKLGLINFVESENRYIRSNRDVMPNLNFAPIELIKYHQKMCEIAKDSIVSVAAQNRDYNTLLISIGKDQIELAKNIMHDACRKIFSLESKNQVLEHLVQFNMQMFPLTVLNEDEKNEMSKNDE